MKVVVAQINSTVGDFAGNVAKILDFTELAKGNGATLVITPELALSGYPPEDLFLQEGFYLACQNALAALVKKINGITLLIGHPYLLGTNLYSAVSIINDSKIIVTHYKNRPIKPNFLDRRYCSESDSNLHIFNLEGAKFGIIIGADMWHESVANAAKEGGVDVLLTLNASRYHINKQASRYQIMRQYVSRSNAALVYANSIGGQDELVFDGASFAMNNQGELTHQFDEFVETLGLVELQNNIPVQGKIISLKILQGAVYQALCLGVKDFVCKNKFSGVLLGLSGGVDSALTLAIAVDALGADKVWAVMMSSEYTADISLQDARTMAKELGVRYSEFSIKLILDQFLGILQNKFEGSQKGKDADIAEENLQARIRGTFLMTLSNKYGSIVLTTSNKSEIAVGYCTLYGDMAGGLAVLKDIYKTRVYQLCHYRNSLGRVIPERVIQRAPSAELRYDQLDQDSLPSYEILDGIIEAYVEKNMSPHEIISMNYAEIDVRQVVELIHASEFKRRQSPIGIHVTERGFDRDRHYPITSKYRDRL